MWTGGRGVKNLIFCGCQKWMTPNAVDHRSDAVNLKLLKYFCKFGIKRTSVTGGTVFIRLTQEVHTKFRKSL